MMVKNMLKRTISILLVAAMLLTILPTIAWAASVDTGVDDLSAESSGNATWETSSGTITGSVSALKEDGCLGDSFTSRTGTLTFKNNSGGRALLYFDYTVNLAEGSATVDGADAKGGSFSKALNAGGTVAISITSPEAEGTTTITISNLKLTAEADVDVTFKAPVNGSYTVNGTAVTADTVKTVKTTDSVTLAATPASGYKIFGWFSSAVNRYIAFDASAAVSFTEATTVEARFVPSSAPVFQVGAMVYTDLSEAISYAQSNGVAKIVLISDGTLPAGDYTIPSGKTLLIPFDDAQTIYTDSPAIAYNSYTDPSAFRMLTMASGAKITVASGGAISLSSKLSSKGQLGGWNGTPTGPDGRIKMNSGSSIVIENGGNLYAWGYIYGSGAVTAKDGATVHEAFQIKDWRGGSATSNVYSYAFILNQYYVQNIEVPLTLYAGATEKLYSAVNASGSAYSMGVTFIGSSGMFNISSGYIVKDYMESTDRLQIDAYGNVSVNPMTMTGLPMIGSIKTDSYVLPITSNITINIHEGVNANITQNIELLPSTEINVSSGATLNIADGKRVYVYDNDDWGNFTGSARLYVIGYSAANGKTTKRTAAGLKDAKILVNGTLNVNGSLFTSAGGAEIVSEGGGKVVLKNAPTATSTIYEMANNSTKTEVTFTAAQLQNGDGSYYKTAGKAAGTEIPYHAAAQKWGGPFYTVTWEVEGQDPVDEIYEKGETPVYKVNGEPATPQKANDAQYTYTFDKWNPAIIPVNGDATYTASFTRTLNTYTVKWLDEDGNVLETDENVPYGTVPEYNGATPTKEQTDSVTYTFSGWSPEVAAVTGDVSYTAQFTEATRTYTITWEDDDGTTLATDLVAYGEMPVYKNGENPVKAADQQYTYTFKEWTPKVVAVTGNATYTATYTPTLNTYTVTWLAEDGTTELATNEVEYGVQPVYNNGVDPVKEPTGAFTYEFAGWVNGENTYQSADLPVVTDDVVYQASFTATPRTYTVTWLNYDGQELKKDEMAYDAAISYDGETPVREGDAQYTYVFAGWQLAETGEDGSVVWSNVDLTTVKVTGDTTLRARFDETINQYKIRWLNDYGTLLREDVLNYGVMPDYGDISTLVKAADAQYSYTFSGWTPQIETVTKDAVYTAVYEKTLNKYTITWKNDDGTTIDTTEVAYGEMPTHAAAYKAPDAQYTYTFDGWSPALTEVTGAATYTATYTTTLNTYTVTWKHEDGTVLETDENVPYGTVPTYDGETPVKQGDAEFSYTFQSWTPAVAAVTGDAVYTAVFTQATNTYTVTWNNDDGTLLELDEAVPYGTVPTYDGAAPTKPATAQDTYTFAGWSPALTADTRVTGNLTFTATYTQSVRSYTITFVTEDGAELDKQTLEYGAMPEYQGQTPVKAATAQYTYTFDGWTPDLETVKGDQVYIAKFAAEVNTYTVTWVNYDGTVLETDLNVPYGQTPAFDGETPARPSTNTQVFTFAGWDPAVAEVTGDVTYTATYEAAARKYVVTWVNYDGTVLQTIEVEYEAPVPAYALTGENGEDRTPVKPGNAQYSYVFAGFDPEVQEGEKVTEDRTFTARFDEIVNTYTITWIAGDKTYTDAVPYGQTPVYDHETPEKAATESVIYTFDHWDPAIAPVTADATYTAVFTESARIYTVTWLDRDGNALKTEEVPYGTLPTAPEVPDVQVQTDLENGVYRFYTWDKQIQAVTGETTYQAQYRFTGLRTTESGKQYLVDDAVQHGWQQVDGKTYYFDYDTGFAATGLAATEQKQDGDKAPGWYVFDDQGVFQAGQNGLYHDGADTYWTENGRVVEQAGLVRVVLPSGEINYYYFGADNKAVKNGTFKVENNNGLKLPAFNYDFDEAGVIVHDADTSKNGICAPTEDDGKLYYMLDGVRVGIGLLRIDDAYYYARTSTAEIVRGRSYWVAVNNGYPIPVGMYSFDADGRMILNGFFQESDKTVYYQDGVMAKGFTKIGEDYYFFNASSGRMYKNAKLWVGENAYGIEPNLYNFGADGKMERSGFVENNGFTYYYRDLVFVKGFTKIEDDYYFFNAGSGKMYKDTTLWVGANDYGFEPGMYYFGPDGKMQVPDLENGQKAIVEVGGKLYFTIDGMRQTNGLNELDGEYYYAQSNGELVVGKTIYVSKKNGLIPDKGNYYAFDAQGRLIKTGFVEGTDGYTYYYDDLVLALGLTKVGDDFYFFNAGSGKLYKDKNLWVGANSYGITPGMHYFDAEGKLKDN